jgi:hypothetical protein
MYKYVIAIFLCLPFTSFSQVKLDFHKADSLSYQYYVNSDWKALIKISKEAFIQNIDSKFMRQRAGYAYFLTNDYYSAINQYKKALEFDASDNISREYLYYSSLYAGSVNTRYYAGKLPGDATIRLNIKEVKPVESIDTEMALKTNKAQERSDQVYYRVGVNSELGYRLSLYQAYAYFEQTISNILTQQPEYLAILTLTISPAWHLKTSYHRLSTRYSNGIYPVNLGLIAISSQINRFNLEANASVMNSASSSTTQTGLQASVVLPGRSNLYFTGYAAGMIGNSSFRTIFSQAAGLKIAGNLWGEGSITIGNLKNYTSHGGLYVYNAYDPTVFRTGGTLVYFAGKHLSIIGNFTFNKQEYNSDSQNNYYYQYSYSGGLKWKL